MANLGKIDTGVVSVTSLFADEHVYYPLHVRPYTPAHHFPKGKNDPAFKTKLVLAVAVVDAALQAQIPFRAVVADCFYGEDETLKAALREREVVYVLALKPTHTWWHQEGTIGSLREAATAAPWTDATTPGDWVRVVRAFRDGQTQTWWALEVNAGPYGPERSQRAVIATTDPATLPDHTTWYLVSTLPAPGSTRAVAATVPAAGLAEIVRLYGFRNWVEQSYKQTKHALGWSQYQVRSDIAIRRHWQLVCCAFSFCWASEGQVLEEDASAVPTATAPATNAPTPPSTEQEGWGENGGHVPPAAVHLARGTPAGALLAGTLDHAQALLARVVDTAPATRTPTAP